jgi:hypothetical protein
MNMLFILVSISIILVCFSARKVAPISILTYVRNSNLYQPKTASKPNSKPPNISLAVRQRTDQKVERTNVFAVNRKLSPSECKFFHIYLVLNWINGHHKLSFF